AHLLTVADLPPGFTVDADNTDTQGHISSTDAHCGPLVDLMNSDGKAPGAVANADASFTKSELGPNIATGLASFPSVPAAQSLLDTVTAAMKSCAALTETDKDGSSYDFGVAPLTFPPTGDAGGAIRMSADIGGYPAQVDIVLARVGSTLLYVANTGLGGTDTGLTEEVAARAVAKVR
ncbi:MAG: sensor domain-containing protein, partial [Catenulispora sp.]|nr:sensor domain-containing protein [Catenulispora sp.]